MELKSSFIYCYFHIPELPDTSVVFYVCLFCFLADFIMWTIPCLIHEQAHWMLSNKGSGQCFIMSLCDVTDLVSVSFSLNE